MGIPGLWSYIRGYLPKRLIQTEEKQKIGIDAHSLLYFWKANEEEFRKFIRELHNAGHQLYFVFDGEAPQEKREELEQRKKLRNDARQEAKEIEDFLNSPKGRKMEYRDIEFLKREKKMLEEISWQITKENREKILNIIKAEGANIILAEFEADDILIEMMRKREITVILTQDMDFLEHAVTRIWIPNFKEYSYSIYDLDIPIFCAEQDINIENLQELAYLCKKKYMTPSEAMSNLRYYGSLKTIKNHRILNEKEILC